ncbi:siderophore synthetase component [Herbaspirillum rubrisubalbicans]|uniref:IucA/IucC family protein n=1 Tax=Herbaspirillum rubrisubalbicans TaxID=80842 RepID=UPI0020A1BE1E|nr:IucA/IucC family protein [Herbaspirillum rubrisubalbicans]MCP1574981.1 siderophore synthetase component [Herbaspirillum rubrisubalbicans]
MTDSMLHVSGIERRLAEQYLNTYCRETGQPDPRLATSTSPEPALAEHCRHWRETALQPFVLDFTHAGVRLAGAFSYFSPIGYHRLGSALWLGQQGVWRRLDDVATLSDLIAGALEAAASGDGAPNLAQGRLRLQALMRNSIAKVRRFHQDTPAEPRPAYAQSEQGLRFGHIFHVTSKASDGFTESDLQAYAPELGASFQLHYFAVRSELLQRRSLEGKAPPIDPAALHYAEPLLREGDYRLLPCHPWQARYLLAQPEVSHLLREGALISLGALGERAWPTSSVRTVWLPQQALFIKLALNIRITNFVRNNPDEHVRRALDASLALSCLPAQRVRQPHFCLLLETASETLRLPDPELRASFAILYRQAMNAEQAAQVHLVATLVEEAADGSVPLQTLLLQAAGSVPPDQAMVQRWWQRYLEVTLLPMLELFADYGVSLEAHLQNSLVGFEQGWPVCGYARDMEGTSISRQRFPLLERLDADSPALYSEAQAWHRFQYYVLVNHIGHVAASLARLGWCDEHSLWEQARRSLLGCTASALPLVDELLQQASLPAKANLLSSFHQQGETPSWITIANPLRK